MTAPSTFRLGFLTHLHGDQPERELYPAILDLFVAAEELGFDTGWVAQHHLQTAEGRLPSPLVFLAAVAARTQRIRLGTAIVALSLEDPLRTAEDASVLDAISDGRLELGIGSGNPDYAQFAAFGKNSDDRRSLFAANAEVLEGALRGRPLPGGLTLTPQAATLADRIWQSPLSIERTRAAAEAGQGVLLGIGPAASVQRELAAAYLDSFDESSGRDPRIAVVHALFPGDDRQQVADRLWPDVQISKPYYVEAGWVPEDAGAATLLKAMNVHHGPAHLIIDDLVSEPLIEVASDLIFAVQAASTPVSDAVKTLELIAGEIAPQLGWIRQ